MDIDNIRLLKPSKMITLLISDLYAAKKMGVQFQMKSWGVSDGNSFKEAVAAKDLKKCHVCVAGAFLIMRAEFEEEENGLIEPFYSKHEYLMYAFDSLRKGDLETFNKRWNNYSKVIFDYEIIEKIMPMWPDNFLHKGEYGSFSEKKFDLFIRGIHGFSEYLKHRGL